MINAFDYLPSWAVAGSGDTQNFKDSTKCWALSFMRDRTRLFSDKISNRNLRVSINESVRSV